MAFSGFSVTVFTANHSVLFCCADHGDDDEKVREEEGGSKGEREALSLIFCRRADDRACCFHQPHRPLNKTHNFIPSWTRQNFLSATIQLFPSFLFKHGRI